MSGTGNPPAGVMVLALLVGPAAAQGPVPAFVPPSEHFYGARGRSVTAEWSADRAEVPAGGDVVVTLTVRGAVNPAEVRRPGLRDLPKFRDRFEVIDPDRPAEPGATEVRFRYILRPRSPAVTEVPELQFDYVNPAAPAGKQVRTTYAKKLPLRVLPPAPAAPPPTVPLEAPEPFFELADRYREATGPGWAGWLGLVLAVPAGVVGWVLVWRAANPGGARLARLRRNRAVARALDALDRAAMAADPAAAAATAVRAYLVERWGMPPAAAVPAEVGAALATTALPADRAAAAAEFLRKCDAARFAPAGAGGRSPADDARQLILGWEGT